MCIAGYHLKKQEGVRKTKKYGDNNDEEKWRFIAQKLIPTC